MAATAFAVLDPLAEEMALCSSVESEAITDWMNCWTLSEDAPEPEEVPEPDDAPETGVSHS